MPTLDLRHYKNQKEPYVAKVIKGPDGASKLDFLPKVKSRSSKDGSYGMYQVTVDKEGFYLIRNAQDDENGYRLFFSTPNGNRFPFIKKYEVIEDIKARILRDEGIGQIAKYLGLL